MRRLTGGLLLAGDDVRVRRLGGESTPGNPLRVLVGAPVELPILGAAEASPLRIGDGLFDLECGERLRAEDVAVPIVRAQEDRVLGRDAVDERTVHGGILEDGDSNVAEDPLAVLFRGLCCEGFAHLGPGGLERFELQDDSRRIRDVVIMRVVQAGDDRLAMDVGAFGVGIGAEHGVIGADLHDPGPRNRDGLSVWCAGYRRVDIPTVEHAYPRGGRAGHGRTRNAGGRRSDRLRP